MGPHRLGAFRRLGWPAGKSDHGQSRPHFSPHIQNHGLRRLPSGKDTHAPTVTPFWFHISRDFGEPCAAPSAVFLRKLALPAKALIQTEWAPPQLFDPDYPPSAHLSCARVVGVAIFNVSASRWGAREDPFDYFFSRKPLTARARYG